MDEYFLGHDAGTGGCKSVLVTMDGTIAAQAFEPYPTMHPKPNRAEQDADEWWRAVAGGTRRVMESSGAAPSRVAAVGFAGQMACVVPVDDSGETTRMPIIWLDSRADAQAARMIRRVGGRRVMLTAAGALPTGKDVICKMAWILENEQDVAERTKYFLDLTGYLVLRATGQMVVDHTGAGATGLLNWKTRQWSGLLFKVVGIPLAKMPPLKGCTDVVGGLSAGAADAMGLPEGVPVIAGMSDIPAAATGSGALGEGDAHIYLGTSSWLCISTAHPRNLGRYGIAAVASADPAKAIMIGESETAGACLEWFAGEFARPEERALAVGGRSIFDVFDEVAGGVEPGADGLIFAPWMFGERSPVPDTTVRACFANLGLAHGRDHMLRALYEGVAYNIRWLVDAAASKGFSCDPVRAIGGGAQGDTWMQTVADVAGRTVEAVRDPQEAGAVGCALAAAVGVGRLEGFEDIKRLRGVRRTFEPRREYKGRYERLYENYRGLYPALSKLGRSLSASGD